MMKLRLANPEHLIDINDLTELSYIREQGDEVLIGALTRHVDLLKSELLAERFPLFRDAENVIADPVVRNRGTIGGSLCQADAAEELYAQAGEIASADCSPSADGRGPIDYKRHLAGVLTTRALLRATARAVPQEA